MPTVDLRFLGDGDGLWPDLAGRTVHHVQGMIGVAGLERGMQSGKPSVSLRIDLPDGSVVLAETSLVIFLSAADALRARYGDPR